MVTNYPHRIASRERFDVETDAHRAEDGFGTTVDKIRQMVCGLLHGHDNLLQFEQDRMCLKCVSCGHESPGWALNGARPAVKAREDNRRRALVRPQLVAARRIA
jgi:hypothetical protein